MSPEWNEFLEGEYKKEYYMELKKFIIERRKSVNVIPASNELFKPFQLCNWGTTFERGMDGVCKSSGPCLKVVIVGGEPNASRGHSHGLAFSSIGSATPSSLQAIFDEIYNDIYGGNTGKVRVFQSNDLSQWARQGVLLLNSISTVDESKPGSHAGKGWEEFTGNAIKYISDHHHYNIVFLLWGKQAGEYEGLIDKKKHLVLVSDHPGVAKHNQNKWYGNRHFSQANSFIEKHYLADRMSINWGTWVPRKSYM